MTEWNLTIPDNTDQVVRKFLSKSHGDLSQYVDQAVRQKLFHDTVKMVKDRNADFDQEELMRLIEEAVDEVRGLVLDTGILISALITKGTPPDKLYQAWRENVYELVTSQFQFDELSRVAQYAKLSRFINDEESQLMIERLRVNAHVLTELPDISLSPDPNDNPILATGIKGHVDLIVSGDKRHMLSLNEVRNIPIVTAKKALVLLTEQSMSVSPFFFPRIRRFQHFPILLLRPVVGENLTH